MIHELDLETMEESVCMEYQELAQNTCKFYILPFVDLSGTAGLYLITYIEITMTFCLAMPLEFVIPMEM
jgi:hypothetical protein